MFTEERALWLYQNYRWLDDHLPARTDGSFPRLILPTPDFYPMRNSRDHAFAQAVFDQTRDYMGIRDWPCTLSPQSEEDQRLSLKSAGLYGESRSHGAAGTFFAGDQVEITYSPALLKNPPGLISTLAHELCHYLLATVATEPPCGWAEHEPLTDLAAVREGFGVFLCNSAFEFGQWGDAHFTGWQSSTRGYLKESELGFSLGVFCVRCGLNPDDIVRVLKPNPGEVFWDSIEYVENLERGWTQKTPHRF
jgi:hypothetical protein